MGTSILLDSLVILTKSPDSRMISPPEVLSGINLTPGSVGMGIVVSGY